MSINRMRFMGVAAAGILGIVTVALAGCGGGGSSSHETVYFNNRSGSGSTLGNVSVQPDASQSGLMSRGSTIVTSWPSLADAPNSFYLSLWRYKEGRGGEDPAEYREGISASQPNPALAQYSLRRSDDQLDEGGVYYLELGSPAQIKRYAFVAARDRSVMIPADAASRDVTVTNNGGTGSLSNLDLHWTDEQYGSASIPLQTTFTLVFPSDAQAPSQFTVRIGRWKEGRGSEGFSYNEQAAAVDHVGNGVWNVYRRDHFDMEEGGTYILEINSATLPQPLRYAFIVQR